MPRLFTRALLLAAVLLCVARAQDPPFPPDSATRISGTFRVITLPTNARVGDLAMVLDSLSGSCTAGSSTTKTWCRYGGTGFGWVSVGAAGGGAIWGAITGTLSDQTDLGTALGLKANLISPTLVTPNLGTPSAINLANATGFKLSCQPGLGDGANTIAAGTYLQTNCYNDTDVTVTIAGIRCYTDNSGTSTLSATNGAGTALLTGAITCTTAYAAGTQSATTTIASGDFIKFTFVGDGTSKQTSWAVKESR